MNKPVYLDLSILKISKMVMYEFQYDYVKQMDTDSFRHGTINYYVIKK